MIWCFVVVIESDAFSCSLSVLCESHGCWHRMGKFCRAGRRCAITNQPELVCLAVAQWTRTSIYSLSRRFVAVGNNTVSGSQQSCPKFASASITSHKAGFVGRVVLIATVLSRKSTCQGAGHPADEPDFHFRRYLAKYRGGVEWVWVSLCWDVVCEVLWGMVVVKRKNPFRVLRVRFCLARSSWHAAEVSKLEQFCYSGLCWHGQFIS